MNIRNTIMGALACLGALPADASAVVIRDSRYGKEYDYTAVFTATDGKNFHVVLGGNAFPPTDPGAVARVLLPVLQAARPPGPALTFTYDPPIERPRPNHHLVLIFNPANDLTSNGVCRGEVRFRPARSGVFNVYAVYCRNDQVMSEAAAWTPATDPADPRIDQLFRELFMVVFAESPPQRPDQRNDRR